MELVVMIAKAYSEYFSFGRSWFFTVPCLVTLSNTYSFMTCFFSFVVLVPPFICINLNRFSLSPSLIMAISLQDMDNHGSPQLILRATCSSTHLLIFFKQVFSASFLCYALWVLNSTTFFSHYVPLKFHQCLSHC